MYRCLKCGCSRTDAGGFLSCTLCGAACGPRTEQCHITDDTKAKLLAHADELKASGVILEEQGPLGKSVDAGLAVGVTGLVIQVAEALSPGVFRKLVLLLRDIAIPDTEILRLRLDEPENVSDVLKGEDKTDNGN